MLLSWEHRPRDPDPFQLGDHRRGKQALEAMGPPPTLPFWGIGHSPSWNPGPVQGGHLPPKRKRVPVSRRRREARRRKLRNPVIPPKTIRMRLRGSRITNVPCMA